MEEALEPESSEPESSEPEQLKVVAVTLGVVLLVIGPILAIPLIDGSMRADSEAQVVQDLEAIHAAQRELRAKGELRADEAPTLEQLGAAGLIDAELASGKRGGYELAVGMTREKGGIFWVSAYPTDPEGFGNGEVAYYQTEDGVLRYSIREHGLPELLPHEAQRVIETQWERNEGPPETETDYGWATR